MSFINRECKSIQLDNDTESCMFKFSSKGTERVIPIHFHKEVGILYCVKGSLIVWIKGEKIILQQNDIYFINSAVPHTIHTMRNSEVIALYVSHAIFKQENVRLYCADSAKQKQQVIGLIEKIYDQSLCNGRFQKYLMKSLILNLEFLLLRYFGKTIGKEDARQFELNIKIGKIITLVRNNFQTNIQLKELAELSGYSVHYLSRLFRTSMGITFNEYKKSLCLEKAITLIDTTDSSLEIIADKSGFPNEKSLRKYFKKNIGMNPRTYRMQKNN